MLFPSQEISHENWLNGHSPSHVEAKAREDGVNCEGADFWFENTHTCAFGRNIDLASFNSCPSENLSVLRTVILLPASKSLSEPRVNS